MPLKYYPETSLKKKKLNCQEKLGKETRTMSQRKFSASLSSKMNDPNWWKTETLLLTDGPDTWPLLLIREGIWKLQHLFALSSIL